MGRTTTLRSSILLATLLAWPGPGAGAAGAPADDCNAGSGPACLKLGSEQLKQLNDDAAVGWYEKACDLKEAEACYALATYWSAKMRAAKPGAERAGFADKGLAYADRALALKPDFVLALMREQFFWEERALTDDAARADEASAKARSFKSRREELTLRLRVSNDPALLLGRQHDFESRPLLSRPSAAVAGEPKALEGGAGFECAPAPLEPLPKPATSGQPTVVLVRWTPPQGKTAWLPVDQAAPWERTHLRVAGRNYAAVAVLSDRPPAMGVTRHFAPLGNFPSDGPGGRKLTGDGTAYRLLFDLPAVAAGPRTLHAVMEVPGTGSRYEVDCSLDPPK